MAPSSRIAAQAALLSLFALLMAAAPSSAFADELRAGLSTGVVVTRPGTSQFQLGPAAQLQLGWRFGEFLALTGGIEGGFGVGRTLDPRDPDDDPIVLENLGLYNAFVGLRYNFDVFKYVPYLTVAAVGYGGGPPTASAEEPGARAGLGAKINLGLDWRPWRFWSLGGFVEVHAASPDLGSFELMSSLQFNLCHYWRL